MSVELTRSLQAAVICSVTLGLFTQSTASHAVTMNGLKGDGFSPIYGTYAPAGNCSHQPRIVIDADGMVFEAANRKVAVNRLEYGASFFGMGYEGTAMAFFPFPTSSGDAGPILMLVNDDEKTGALRVESNAEPDQRLDPFHAAIVGIYQRCAGTARSVSSAAPSKPTAVATTPLEWTNLTESVGKYPGDYSKDNIDPFEQGAIAAALRVLLGPKITVLKTNLSAVGPLQREGNVYSLVGNAPHRGGEDQAYILIDAAKRAVQVGLWEKGKLTTYAPKSGRLDATSDVRTMLSHSPRETANAAPGTPWELLPVKGRAPVAYVEAAASPSITSLSLYCENGRPYAAMLLSKAAAGTKITLTWNFAGRLVNVPVSRATNDGTYWVGAIAGTALISQLVVQTGTVDLRINGRQEGQASLANAVPVLRTALRQCVAM